MVCADERPFANDLRQRGAHMKILLALDDSKSSQAAMRMISRHFQRKGTQVRVLHVVAPIRAYVSVDMIPHLVPRVEAIEQDRRKQAKQLVDRAARQLSKAGFKASGVVEEGDPKARIIDYADTWRADLIVLGSHGAKGLGRFLLGSVSEGVSRHAGCSVEIVRSPSKRAQANQR
jgi:nucleotide-binding universal stress UspA family protein